MKLFNSSQELKVEIYNNLSSIIRSGNSYVAEIILKDILLTPNNNKYNYSQEHYELLIGNSMLWNHYKKFSLIKTNDGPNNCTPIHCAAISNNPDFLRKLLKIFTDVINVEDSYHRKPIHYASLCFNPENLYALV